MTKQFILDTLLPYKNDQTLLSLSLSGTGCSYLNNEGKKCAIGKYMKEGPWQTFSGWAVELFRINDEKNIMSQEWLDQQIPIKVALNMQQYHDLIALNDSKKSIDNVISNLEQLTGFKFPELYIK
jgi:hypothetical protein